jgi:FAD dependent oxidoreductase/Concanavalin A-like lectin/glucanases superfamily
MHCFRAATALGIGLAFVLGTTAWADGLVAHWDFDDAKKGVVPDKSGNGNDALVQSGTLVKGVSGAGLQFDGRHTTLRCPGIAHHFSGDAVSVEAWVNLDRLGFAGFPAVVRHEGAFALRFAEDRLGFLLWIDGEPIALTSAKTDWRNGRWYHLAATYDGAAMRLYVDGEEDSASPKAQAGRFDTPGGNCGIGSCGGQYILRGTIDEVLIHTHATTAQEILDRFETGQRALESQRGRVVEPRSIGDKPKTFQKPTRDITMVEEGFLWIDAEDFTDYGGWLLDTQFVHLMGSAYLIAAGVGTPVDDATAEVNIAKPGTYRLWVRTRDWFPEHSPGTFQVLVNGEACKPTFGQEEGSDEWSWKPGGEFALPEGKTRIALHDITGYYGRCDALILTTGLDYTPPNDLEELKLERSRLTGLSLEPQDGGEFDVIVVGAGAAGSVAALASARMGAKTALIQNRPVLGGNASVELGVPINGAASAHPNARESGIIEEVGRIKARYGHPKMSEPFRIAAKDEKNLSVFLNNHVYTVGMAGQTRIAYVEAVDTLTNRITCYRARQFIDCTGDGWVGYFAGAEYRLGREGRDEFDESLAPEAPDSITMSGCLMGRRALSYRAEDAGKPVAYTPPPWALKLPSAEEFGRKPKNMTTGEWWLEHPGHIDDLWGAERARDELLRVTFGYWDYIKNAWPDRRRAANYHLAYVPIVEAKRETRRLVGDYVLTQDEVLNGRVFPDRISYGGWPLDVHHPQGILSGKEGPFHSNNHVPIYTIPFRCLYSVNVDNLLFAGRDMSVSHMALGSVRVQGTLSALGQAAGTAAAMCAAREVTPRGLYRNHIGELQQTLVKHDQYIPGITNEDPVDLARKAAVTASSTAHYEYFGKEDVQKGKAHPLNMPRAVMFPVGGVESIESVHLLLIAPSVKQGPTVTLHLRAANASGNFSSTKDVAVVEAAVPVGRESWVEFPLNARLDAPFAWVWLEKNEHVSWRLMDRAPIGSCRAYGGGATGPWTVVEGSHYAFYGRPEVGAEVDCNVAHVTNGKTRIAGKSLNLWASDPTQPMPQWVELRFDEPVDVNTVYLTFDTDMNAPYHTVPIVRQCVRDYELSFREGTEWKTLATVRNNFQRRRVHRFDPVSASALRLTVHATNGDRSARVFEIRAYLE